MWRCKIIDFLITIFPVKSWQGFLIRMHISQCKFCQKRLADKTDVYSLLIPENDIENIKDFWPGVKTSLQNKEKDTLWPRLFLGKWVFRTAVFLAVVVTGLWVFNNQGRNRPPADEVSQERFHINFIRVNNKPARTYFYQSKDSEMIYVWAEKDERDKGV